MKWLYVDVLWDALIVFSSLVSMYACLSVTCRLSNVYVSKVREGWVPASGGLFAYCVCCAFLWVRCDPHVLYILLCGDQSMDMSVSPTQTMIWPHCRDSASHGGHTYIHRSLPYLQQRKVQGLSQSPWSGLWNRLLTPKDL